MDADGKSNTPEESSYQEKCNERKLPSYCNNLNPKIIESSCKFSGSHDCSHNTCIWSCL